MLQLQAPAEVLENLKAIQLGASSSLAVGQKVRGSAWQRGARGARVHRRDPPPALGEGLQRAPTAACDILAGTWVGLHGILCPAALAPTCALASWAAPLPSRAFLLQVFAIGNPFGLDHTLTSGIISGLNRELNTGGVGWGGAGGQAGRCGWVGGAVGWGGRREGRQAGLRLEATARGQPGHAATSVRCLSPSLACAPAVPP